MKLRFVFCWAILLCLTHTLARAQSITLDSLWGRFVGGMNTMSFSPDSKHLLIADDTGGVKVLNALTGDEVYYFTPQYGCDEIKFSSDGKHMYLAGAEGMDIRDTKTYQRIDTLKFITPKGYISSTFDISPDEKYVLYQTGYGGMNEDYVRYIVLSYPEKQVVWQKDVVSYSVPLKTRYEGGKVVFSNDGNYILGLNTTSLCKWDWRDSTKPAEVLINNLPNLELISFSPDRNYFVLKTHQLWSIPLHKKVDITDIGGYNVYNDFALFTKDSKYILWNQDETLRIVDLQTLVTKYIGINYSGKVALNTDESLLAQQTVRYTGKVSKINWNVSNIKDDILSDYQINITPIPSNLQTVFTVMTTKYLGVVKLTITNEQGIELKTLHTGNLEIGDNVFSINNQTLPSGTYFLQLVVGTQRITKQFIITK